MAGDLIVPSRLTFHVTEIGQEIILIVTRLMAAAIVL